MASLAPPALEASPPALPSGDVVVKPTRLDFGDRGHGETVERTVVVRNTSQEPVQILSIRPSCGCTKVRPRQVARPLKPGESLPLTVSMSSGRALGVLDKHVTIAFSGGRAAVEIATRMRVFPGVRTEPYQFRFEGEVEGKPVTESIEIRGPRPGEAPDLRIERVIAGSRDGPSLDRYFSWKIDPIPAGERVTLTLRPNHPEGRVFGTLIARLNGKPFHLPISGEMFRGLRVSPPYLNFNRVEVADPKTLIETSELVSIDGRAFKVEKIDVKFSRSGRKGETAVDLHVQPRSLDGGRRCRLTAFLAPRSTAPPEGGFSGEVKILTTHPEKREVTLRFFGFFPRPRAGIPNGIR